MFSSICLLFFLAFILRMNRSTRISWQDKPILLQSLAKSPFRSKFLEIALFLVAICTTVVQFGLGCGLFASIFIVMAIGSLVVLFFPFRYLKLSLFSGLFIFCFFLEYFIS